MITSALNRIPRLDQLVQHSIEVIRDGQADSGAFVASPTFPTYRYSWFRDGAFIADAMSRHGHHDSADRFNAWCADVITSRADQIAQLVARAAGGDRPTHEEHLRTRYTVEGHEAEGFWENFQLDGYGTWLWALRHHHDRAGNGSDAPVAAVTTIVPYLAAFWDNPSYDWWEEHLEQRHVSTKASIWAGLHAVADWDAIPAATRTIAAAAAVEIRRLIDREGIHHGALVKWLGSDQVDASLVACLTPFELYPPDHPVAQRTIARIEAELAPAGVHRYRDDVYYGGGQWILLTAFLAWHHLRAGDHGRAAELLQWITSRADEHGNLPEQVAEGLLHPDHLERWEQRWGPSANPLLWSHAMLLDVVAELPGTGTAMPDTGAAMSDPGAAMPDAGRAMPDTIAGPPDAETELPR